MDFLVTPRRVVRDGLVTDEVVYLPADEEDISYVGRANTPLDEDGRVKGPDVHCRFQNEVVPVEPERTSVPRHIPQADRLSLHSPYPLSGT